MLKVHETVHADGSLEEVFLDVLPNEGEEDDHPPLLTLTMASSAGPPSAGRRRTLPAGAIDSVMKRYGAPLDPNEQAKLLRVAKLDLGDGCALHHVRHLARYDVIARDYLLYETSDREPICALATTVAAALGHLAEAMGADV